MASPPPEPTSGSVVDEDKRLVLAFKAGDEDSYRDIYERHRAAVRMITCRMLKNPHDRDEAFQETFLKVYTALGRFNGRYQLGAWIGRIATNVCLDMIRARGRKPCDPHTLEDLEHEMVTGETDGDPEWSALRHYEESNVKLVLDRLPEMHRSAIWMRYYDGLCYTDIAAKLGISESQTKALLHRARKSFKRSWPSAVAGVFLPTRWFSKLRRFRGVEGEAARSSRFMSDAVASVQQAATSCGAFAQQCGQAAAERFAAAATTMAIGATTLAGPALAHAVPASATVEEPVVASRAAEEGSQAVAVLNRRYKRSAAPKSNTETLAPAPDPAPAATPAPEATAAPEAPPPATEEEGTIDGGTEPKEAEPQPTSSPTPTPFTAAIGFAGGTISQHIPTSRAEEVNCDIRKMWQNLDVGVSLDGHTHLGTTRLVISSQTGSSELGITVDGRRYRYSSWGAAPVATWTFDGSLASVALTGEYGPLYDSHPTTANLPDAGRFEIELTLDCSALRVVAQSVTFRPGQ